jgi:hypothetical protein
VEPPSTNRKYGGSKDRFGGVRQIKRAIVFIDIDAKSGSQTTTGGEATYYPFEACETMEEVCNENAAQ